VCNSHCDALRRVLETIPNQIVIVIPNAPNNCCNYSCNIRILIPTTNIKKNTILTLLVCCVLGSMTPLNPTLIHTLLLSLQPKKICQSSSSLLVHKGHSLGHAIWHSHRQVWDGKQPRHTLKIRCLVFGAAWWAI
jgi:hypothetical protein